MQVILKIKSYMDQLKPAEKKVAEYILENSEEIIHLSITRLAKKISVSEATIVKLAQKIGCSGYQELKILLAQSNNNNDTEEKHIYGEIEEEDSLDVITDKIFKIYDYSFKNTKKLLENVNLENCINYFMDSNRVFFFGYGASGIVAEDAQLKFKRIGFTAEALKNSHNQKTVASLLTEKDLVVGISDSGKTKELIDSLRIAKEEGAKIVAITSNMGSPITNIADISLFTSSKETPFRGSALASRMAQLAVLDVIFLGVAVSCYDDTIDALRKTRVVMQTSKLN